MKKLIYLFVMAMLLGGCATPESLSRITAPNRENLIKLSVGMEKAKVIEIMGNKSFDVTVPQYVGVFGSRRNTRVTITNPYRSEILQGKDKVLEVIYYVTDVKKEAIAISDDELTPLVFDNGKLIGWGNSFLQNNIQKYEIRVR